VFIGFIISLFLCLPLSSFFAYKYFIASLVLMFITGVRDDLIPLKPSLKLLSQLIPALMMVLFFKLELNSLYGLFGIESLPTIITLPLTCLTIIVITNSFNLIDGIDGLAGSVGLICSIFFGVWFLLAGELVPGILAISLGGTALAFLIYNWAPSKIFMGDTGALTIGFLLSFFTIAFINVNYSLEGVSSLKFQGTISTAVCVLIVPLFDTLRVFISRWLRKRSPFTADKTHVHHLLLRLGCNHAQATLIILFFNIFFITVAIIFRDLGDRSLLPAVIGVALMTSFLLDYLLVRKFKKSVNFKTRVERKLKAPAEETAISQ